jgi:hypothetical protein
VRFELNSFDKQEVDRTRIYDTGTRAEIFAGHL